MKIHLVLYSNGEPFNTTKQKILESVGKYSKNNIIIHNYDLNTIKNIYWFKQIKDLPTINNGGKRDGYYNCWKSFIVRDVYNLLENDDILYYVDCSQYYIEGFTENIDKLCDTVNKYIFIAGSVGKDILNNSFGCCDKLSIWNKIIPDNDNSIFLNKMHVLNSWFLLKKNSRVYNFLQEWAHFSCYTDADLNDPLVVYHHTADQSIFNILVVKYKWPVFFSENILHNENKNKNIVLNIINNSDSITDYFIIL